MTHVAASVPVLRWAARRARKTDEELCQRFTKWPLWLSGEAQPTLRQLEDFAQFTHTGIGYFFLPEPPSQPLPLRDFRTLRDHELAEPSSELLDTIYLCQRRQDWYREHARLNGWPPLSFVGSLSVQTPAVEAARMMRQTIQLSTEARRRFPTWEEALRQLIARIEDSGVLVMASSVVGSNSHRKLDVGEFRGFTLADELAPVIFLNAADSKAAQMFTLGHELAHVWLGQSGISNAVPHQMPYDQTERWCHQVATKLLMTIPQGKTEPRPATRVSDEMQISKRFSRALVSSTLEGCTLFRDAFRMLGIRSSAALHEMAHKQEEAR